MIFDAVNIITTVSIVAAIGFLVRTVFEVRKESKRKKESTSKAEQYMSDYDQVLMATSSLEKAREKNTGEHFDDETIYLNRAQDIRENSPIFKWINDR